MDKRKYVRVQKAGKYVYGPTRAHLNRYQTKQVRSLINKGIETKYRDYTYSGLTITSTPQLLGLPFDVPQGDSVNSRDGNRFNLWRLTLRYELTAGDEYNVVRLIIFQWKGLSTAAPLPTPSSILAIGPTLSIDVNSQYNFDNQNDMVILYDRVHTLIGNGGGTASPYTSKSIQSVKKIVKLKRARKTVEVDTTGQGTNRLFFLYISDSSAAVHPTMEWMSRLEFKDI